MFNHPFYGIAITPVRDNNRLVRGILTVVLLLCCGCRGVVDALEGVRESRALVGGGRGGATGPLHRYLTERTLQLLSYFRCFYNR